MGCWNESVLIPDVYPYREALRSHSCHPHLQPNCPRCLLQWMYPNWQRRQVEDEIKAWYVVLIVPNKYHWNIVMCQKATSRIIHEFLADLSKSNVFLYDLSSCVCVYLWFCYEWKSMSYWHVTQWPMAWLVTDGYGISPTNMTSGSHSDQMKSFVIDSARDWPYYFCRFFPVNVSCGGVHCSHGL